MIEMPQEPVQQYPDPPDPHEACERDIAHLESELKAATLAARPISFAELHALVAALVGDRTYSVSVQTWRHLGGRSETTWAIAWFPDDSNPKLCRRFDAPTAARVYELLRAAVPPNPLDEVGDLPW
jgi:hypothetical protein